MEPTADSQRRAGARAYEPVTFRVNHSTFRSVGVRGYANDIRDPHSEGDSY